MSTRFGLERKETLPTQALAYCSILERSLLAYPFLQLKGARCSLWEICQFCITCKLHIAIIVFRKSKKAN